MEDDLKYMLLIYSNPETWERLSEAEQQKLMGDAGAIMQELSDNGEWVGGAALTDPSLTKVVKVRNGTPAVTDGPFIEAKEYLAGYCVIECDTPERAVDIATRWPDACYTAVELRPIMDVSGGLEM
jgi:hypothetical protein